jgi:hypothetical protein
MEREETPFARATEGKTKKAHPINQMSFNILKEDILKLLI